MIVLTAMDEIEAERRRQIESEGWTAAHDDEHDDGALMRAAGCYFAHATGRAYYEQGLPLGWSWAREWWKPKGPRRDLVRSGALYLAERDRTLRANPTARVAHLDDMVARCVRAIEAIDRGERP